MTDLIRNIDCSEDISAAAGELRQAVRSNEIVLDTILDIFEAWAAALDSATTRHIPGVAFLRLWLRRGTLEPIIARELGQGALFGDWTREGQARLRPHPVGVVGHWPAGNIEIQPVLTLTCGLLGGNACLVRVPKGIKDQTILLMEKLVECDRNRILTSRVSMLVFDRDRQDLHQAMARSVDGAMIWGGAEAVLDIRSLPFPYWARLAVFGPRISAAAMDSDSWGNLQERETLCRRIARDVWQFDQQACSSPQVLFLEKKEGYSGYEFVQSLQAAFESENRLHPRETIDAALTTAICRSRASWLLEDVANRAIFSKGPEWTILFGEGAEIPHPAQGRTLTVKEVSDLFEAVEMLDGNVQTLGLAMADSEREKRLASVAARRGVDRIVPLGRMHVFAPPWDGVDLIRIMVRMVRYVSAIE